MPRLTTAKSFFAIFSPYIHSSVKTYHFDIQSKFRAIAPSISPRTNDPPQIGTSATRYAIRTYSRRERKKRNTLKKKGMTSHARWWHTARAVGSVDGVRIIVTLAAKGGREGRKGGEKGKKNRASCVPPWTTLSRGKGGAGRGQAPRGVRERAGKASEQAGKKSARVARVSYAGTTHAVVEVGACSRPAAASWRQPPLSFRAPLSGPLPRAPSCPYARSPRVPQAHASRHRRSRHPPPL